MACTVTVPCPTPNITYFGDYVSYANTTTDGAFGFVIVFMVFLVAFIGLRAFPMKQSLPVSLFITLVAASLLAAGGFVSQTAVYLILAVTVASAIMLNLQREG